MIPTSNAYERCHEKTNTLQRPGGYRCMFWFCRDVQGNSVVPAPLLIPTPPSDGHPGSRWRHTQLLDTPSVVTETPEVAFIFYLVLMDLN